MATNDKAGQKAVEGHSRDWTQPPAEVIEDKRGDELRKMAQDLHDATTRRRRGGVVVAPAHVYAVHPDTGDEVVFVPGEALPEWAVEAAVAGVGGQWVRGDDGLLRVYMGGRKPS
ncbi:hypothetical protein [Micromonospora chersina]|uniref:hypothetical protein n=1 Tax=Micromonospora chersina TaxID=47854 RepID=UPI0037211DFE